MSAMIDGLGGPAGFGETSLIRGDDKFSDLISLTQAFPDGLSFFGALFTALRVNTNGGVSFGAGIDLFTPSAITGNTGTPIIAPFLADVDTRGAPAAPTPGGTSRGTGLVWYDQDDVSFTVTWDDVGYYGYAQAHTEAPNAFQLRLTRVGAQDFDIDFRYEDVNWTSGDASGGTGGLGGTAARVGYSAGDGVNYVELPQSGDQNGLLALESSSNIGEAGHYRFSVRSGTGTPTGTAGSDVITGGAGVDTLPVDTGIRGAQIEAANGLPVRVSTPGGIYALRGIETLSFVDGKLVFDAHEPAAQVVRMYHAALDRGPEQAGLNYYVSALEHGGTLAGIAAGFNQSPEFQMRFGGGLSDDAYVGRLYDNVLDRGASEVELQFYRDQFAAGGTREQMLANFSESPENQARTATLLSNGIWLYDENAAAVARLYDTMFARLPDLDGLRYYRGLLDSGADTTLGIVRNFTASPEFRHLYGDNPGNAEFVDLLYRNTLERSASSAESDFYVSQLNAGTLSRAQAVLNFSDSPEHVALTASDLGLDAPGHYGIAFI